MLVANGSFTPEERALGVETRLNHEILEVGVHSDQVTVVHDETASRVLGDGRLLVLVTEADAHAAGRDHRRFPPARFFCFRHGTLDSARRRLSCVTFPSNTSNGDFPFRRRSRRDDNFPRAKLRLLLQHAGPPHVALSVVAESASSPCGVSRPPSLYLWLFLRALQLSGLLFRSSHQCPARRLDSERQDRLSRFAAPLRRRSQRLHFARSG